MSFGSLFYLCNTNNTVTATDAAALTEALERNPVLSNEALSREHCWCSSFRS